MSERISGFSFLLAWPSVLLGEENPTMLKIYACIWSNDKAAEMAKFYKSIFRGTQVGKTSYWGSNPMGVKE